MCEHLLMSRQDNVLKKPLFSQFFELNFQMNLF